MGASTSYISIDDGVRAAAHEPGERAEIEELEGRLGAALRDELRARQDVMVRLAGDQRAVDEDARAGSSSGAGRWLVALVEDLRRAALTLGGALSGRPACRIA